MKLNPVQEFYNELLKKGEIFVANIRSPYGTNIQSEYTSNPFYEQSNKSFNIYYLHTADFLQTVKKYPLYLGHLPPNIYNENDVWALIQQNYLSILTLDESYIQPSMYAMAVLKEPRLIGLLNPVFQTRECAHAAVKKEPLTLQYIRDDLKYYYICQDAVARDWRAIEYVPQTIIDSKLIDIAKANEDAFLLDKIDSSLLDVDFYVEQLVRFPIQGATHLIAKNLISNEDRIAELVSIIETLDGYGPEFIFNNCDPKILMHHTKYNAFVFLFKKRPHWIQYLNPAFVTREIFEIAIENEIYPSLDGINWSGDLIASAFLVNKKAYIKLPLERLHSVGVDRITQTILEAGENGWINELPNYFFIDEVINSYELRSFLIENRASFAYVLAQSSNLDWDKVISHNFSIAEYRLSRTPIPTETIDRLFKSSIECYVALSDEQKTFERTSQFLLKYPNEVISIPQAIKNKVEAMRLLLESNSMIARYLTKEQVYEIYKD